MEQKDYKMEVVLLLLKKPNHIRAMARELKTNHMLILRKTKELEKENVVDFKEEGKNKTYFLKKTVEAREHILTAEHYKLTRTLFSYPGLRLIVEKIQNDRSIRLAMFFGSYAKGFAKKDSDIDVYIETKNTEIKKSLEMTDTKLSIKIGEYRRENNLIKEMEKEHVIIKGVEDYYEKQIFDKSIWTYPFRDL